MTSIVYTAPDVPLILTVASFLYLANVAETLFQDFIHAGLLGSLCIGIICGQEVANILPEPLESAFITIGYIGLLLIVFEAGLLTRPSLLFDNILLSCAVALSGMLTPIGVSMLLLHFGYGYPLVQSFAAGAALSSTSLGTTLSLLKHAYRQTRTGTVLMAAALLDDIAGLVIAAILSQLSAHSSLSSIIIARPILVSLGFAFGIPILAVLSRRVVQLTVTTRAALLSPNGQLFVLVGTLSGFVAGAKYAGTSELFGAYLAGAYLTHMFEPADPDADASTTPLATFERYLTPVVRVVFSPLFFASIGIALPIRSFGSVDGSSRVVWRGIVYSLLMAISKAVVGLWMLLWPDRASGRGWFGRPGVYDAQQEMIRMDERTPSAPSVAEHVQQPDFTPVQSAALVGLAMIARGEIALIVAEISRPLLGISEAGRTSEPFAIVIWATLLNTAGGAIAVGLLLKRHR
ncbi:putative Na(+)/H(+) antiporter GerT [Favolaschia claudopus]|uniref:Na(+)/H(+) antiporter GerT n=1 Tax=Favolaschia claudopus TaxID=2862362 RepID=A0AAW0CSJ7_9AGAR